MSIILWKGGVGGGAAPPPQPLRMQPLLELRTADNAWTDITHYWRADTPIVCSYGIRGSDPTDCVASAGSLDWDMDNGARAGVPLGWTSSVSAARLPGWRLGAQIRFSIGQVGGGPRTYKFIGCLAKSTPDDTGMHGGRRTLCTALDWWDMAARMAAPALAAQANITSGNAITMVYNSLPSMPTLIPPGVAVIDAGVETFEWCFDGGIANSLTVRELLNHICLSEGTGRSYSRGTTDSSAAMFVYEDRQHRQNLTSVLDLTDAEITSLELSSSTDDLYNHVRVIAHPVQLDQAPTAVLYRLDSPNLYVEAGQTLKLAGLYQAPDTAELVGAIGQIQPVPDTDYRANTSRDGSGTDLTAAFTVLGYFDGTYASFVITNTGGVGGWVTEVQLRAQGLRRTAAQVDRDIPNAEYGAGLLELDLAFQSNINTADSLATLYQDYFGQPYARVRSVTFCASRSQLLLDAARLIEPGAAITITEATTGLVAQLFVVNAVTLTLSGAGILWATLGVERANLQHFWELDVDTLDQTTYLGF